MLIVLPGNILWSTWAIKKTNREKSAKEKLYQEKLERKREIQGLQIYLFFKASSILL